MTGLQGPLMAWVATTFTVATTNIVEMAKEGGTLGGQALMFAGLIVLGWVILKLYANQASLHQKVIDANTAQRELDRIHHQELVEQLRAERNNHVAERGQNFQTLLTISRDSIIASSENASATRALIAALQGVEINIKHDENL